MTIATGTRFGQYEITAPLGKGGMGEVYLAEDARLKRKVALKLLPTEFTLHSERLRRFEQEAQATSALNHPNIITIHEIGAQNGAHYIATEFIAGETLRDRLQQSLSRREALEIALQIANALAAAHEAGIVHRDIKPENVMLRTDGIVKVLDFGLAKLMEMRNADFGQRSASNWNEEAETLVQAEQGNPHSAISNPQSPIPNPHSTAAGTVMGTASYMSPEQARGQKVDARTDIFSLGVVLYEMLAGKRPFAGVNMIDVLGAIMHETPAPLPDVPAELQRIVTCALQKDRDDRYQTINDLQLDLKTLQRELEFTAEAQRRADLEPSSRAALGAQASRLPLASVREANRVVSEPAEDKAPPSPSERAALHALAAGKMPALPGASRGKRAALAISLLTLVLVAAAAYFFLNRKAAPTFAEREPILLTDFENKTGEEIWDGTLKQALAVALEQSPYMNIFPDERARDTLRLMNRSVDEPITRATGREICQRRNVRALLIGTIAKLDRSYTVTLEATNAQSGETIARTLEQAAGRDEVLNALGRAAKDLREKLGESLASLQKYDRPLEEVTTSSLEALKAYSKGRDLFWSGQQQEAASFYRRALELDENFTYASYVLGVVLRNSGSMTQAIPLIEKAWQRRDQLSERESLNMSHNYFGSVVGDLDKAVEAATLLAQTYPENFTGVNAIGAWSRMLGQAEKSVDAYRKERQLVPDRAVTNLTRSLIRLNSFDEAEQEIRQGMTRQPSAGSHRFYQAHLFHLAFVKSDMEQLNRQIAWFAAQPPDYEFQTELARVATVTGRRVQARELFQKAAALTEARSLIDQQTGILCEEAAAYVYFGLTGKAQEQTARALSLIRNSNADLSAHVTGGLAQITNARLFVGWVLALNGDAAKAKALADELLQKHPQDTMAKFIWGPLTLATIELQRDNPAKAIELLQPAIQYEAAPASSFRPNWIRAQAYLQLKQGAQGAAEFQKIIDHRGWDVTSPLWPLAHLGLARAAVLQSNTAKAKQYYDEFFRLWKDADADLPVLLEAKKEAAKLK